MTRLSASRYFKHTPIKTEGNVSFPIQIDFITDVLLRIIGNVDDIYQILIHMLKKLIVRYRNSPVYPFC